MKRLVALYLVLISCLLAIHQASSQLLTTGVGQGAAGGGYLGPGDIATFTRWWGLRAYSKADLGSKLLNVCNVSDMMCVDFSSSATTGALVVTTVGGSDCSVVTCTVKTWYDRSGNAGDVTQTAISRRATFSTNCAALSGKPCVVLVAASTQCYTGSGTITLAQPYTTVWTAAGTTGAANGIRSVLSVASDTSESNITLGTNNVLASIANTLVVNSSNQISRDVMGAMVGVFNGASSQINLNGTSTVGNAGVGGISAVGPVLFAFGSAGPACGGQYLDGKFLEGGFAAGGFSAGTVSSMTSNIRGYWGF